MMHLADDRGPLRVEVRDPAPLLSSASTAWAGVPFELHRCQSLSRVPGAAGEETLLVLVEGAAELAFCGRERDVYHRMGAGSMAVQPAGTALRVARAREGATLLALRLTARWLERMRHDGAPDRFGHRPPTPPDDLPRSLASALCAEVAGGAASGRLFAESLSMTLLSYALEHLPPCPGHSMRVRGALTAGQQRRLRRYIDERLEDNLKLSDLAALCDVSPRHFSTLFRKAFGASPHRYLMERRLARGAQLLRSSGYDISEVSLRSGFCSPSHFASEFRRAYGQTPRQYAAAARGELAAQTAGAA